MVVAEWFFQAWQGTGDPAVDEAVARLAALESGGSPADHLAMLTDVHESLRQRLSAAAE